MLVGFRSKSRVDLSNNSWQCRFSWFIKFYSLSFFLFTAPKSVAFARTSLKKDKKEPLP
jgi:hypothetical protein